MVEVAKKGKSHLIEVIEDVKEHKKLIRTRNNVLVIYSKSNSAVSVNVNGDVGRLHDDESSKSEMMSNDVGELMMQVLPCNLCAYYSMGDP